MPATRERAKEHNKFFKELPHAKPYYDAIIRKYGLENKKPMARGGYADVYSLPNDRVVRIEIGKANENEQDAILYLQKAFEKALPDLTPQLEESTVHDLSVDARQPDRIYRVFVSAKVYPRLKIVPWSKWRDYFEDERDVVSALFNIAEAILEAGFVHRDVSHGNIVLTPDGIRVLDYDTACMYDFPKAPAAYRKYLGNACQLNNGGTPGYTAPEYGDQYAEFSKKQEAAYNNFTQREYGMTIDLGLSENGWERRPTVD